MPPIDNDLTFFNLLLLYCCLFWGCPFASLGSGYTAARRSARPLFPSVIELRLSALLSLFSLRSKKLGLAFGHCYLSLSQCGPSGLQNRLLDQDCRSRFF